MPRDAKVGFGLGERERDFLEENLFLSDPKRDRVGVVGDMVMNLRVWFDEENKLVSCKDQSRGKLVRYNSGHRCRLKRRHG
jgi:hypothetical protein